jgi:hypothetical protein
MNAPELVTGEPGESCEDRGAEDDPERGLRQIATRGLLRELTGDEFEMILDQREVGSPLIGDLCAMPAAETGKTPMRGVRMALLTREPRGG